MGRVFLSHNHLDKPFVRMIAEDIKASGLQIWLDEVELKVGDSLILRIAKAIGDAAHVVAFLSKNSLGSKWVEKELSIATTLGINGNRVIVLPLLLGEIKTEDIPTFLIDQLYADFRRPERYDSAFRDLLRRLKPRAIPEKILTIDAHRKNQLIAQSEDPFMRKWMIEYLIAATQQRADPTERHWAYLTLAELGGERVTEAIQNGLSDGNEFARSGAVAAWRFLGRSD